MLKIKNSYAEALVMEILTPSSERVKAKCKFFGTCGGCKQQDLDYDAQVKYKQQQVEEIFHKLRWIFWILKLNQLFHRKMFFIIETKWNFLLVKKDG
ncbi:MAG: hypothetical protein MZV64_51585 [Ignavibacteriales bacterium]|nr:hypothetical protein [Ignavibacteriales bacterium]